ncbi:MAG: hemolysin family protein [Planctomycetota bacterium]
MIWWIIMSLMGLSWSTALHLALRLPSRARLAGHWNSEGLRDQWEVFLAARPHFVMTAALLRTVFTLASFLLILIKGQPESLTLHDRNLWITAGIALGLVLVFGVAIPNAWAIHRGEWLLIRSLPFLRLLRIACYPVLLFLMLFDPIVRRLAGVPERDAQSHVDELEQEILHAVTEGERQGAVDETEKEMIESVIELADTRADAIMTPRTDITALAVDADYQKVLDTIRTKGHSRIPIYDQTIDTILGVLYVKDILRRTDEQPFQLRPMMRKAHFIPESKMLRDLLHEFQDRKVHIAIVLDEYGGTAGLVTIEDILEELVGEITDEYDAKTPQELQRIDDATVEIDARMKIHELNDHLQIRLPEDRDYETVGGFVLSTLGRIPAIGEFCTIDNVGIQVIGAEPRRVTRLRVTLHSSADDNNRSN